VSAAPAAPSSAEPLPSLRQRPLPDFRLADADVRRDTGSTAAALGLLGILLLVALILTFFSGFATGESFMKSSRWAENVVPLALLLTAGVTLAAPVPVVVRLFRKQEVSAGRVVLGCLLYFGVLATALVGLFVLFFVACLAGLANK
jgi:hypothetical protein